MKRVIIAGAAVIAALAVLSVSGVPGASAHERRTVGGKYTFVVGWLNEPALLEEPNGIDLRITNAQTNEPVEGVEKTLKADVTAGGQTKTMDLEPRFGQKGAYTATILPTKTGTWTFRFYGTIEGTQIDEKFESGPNRFGDVEAKSDLQFPVKEPSIGELAQKIGATDAGQPAAATSGQGTNPDLQRALDKSNSARTMALGFGIAGIAVGIIGIAVGAYALSTRKGGPSGGASSGRVPGSGEPV